MSGTEDRIRLFAGTYRGGGGAGLQSIRRDEHGCWILAGAYPDAPNASFGVHSARYDLHYLVDEEAAGSVGVYRHGPSGWTKLADLPTKGSDPCHVALSPSGTLLAVANYASGSMSLIRLDRRSGLPEGCADVYANDGSGSHPQRQTGPHAHWVGFDPDGRWLYQTDLGTDEIRAFPVDGHDRAGNPHRAWRAPAGSGPRHLLAHPHLPTRFYLASELSNTVTVLDGGGGMFSDTGTLSTLPDDWHGDSIVAHIAINRAGDRLYVSNRGHDSIAVFALDEAGVPTLMQHAPAGGAYPRFFLLLEERGLMIVANEKAQTVTMLPIACDGGLRPVTASLAVPGAAFVIAVH